MQTEMQRERQRKTTAEKEWVGAAEGRAHHFFPAVTHPMTGGPLTFLSAFTHARLLLLLLLLLCYAMLCYAMLCYAMLCYANAMLCYAMLCYVMLCYAVLCCAVLC